MNTDVVTPPTEQAPVTPKPEAQLAKPKEETAPLSIKQHAEQFGEARGVPINGARPRRDEDRGSPEDAKAIAEHTKRYRETLAAAGITQRTGESNRAFNVRATAELAERAVNGLKPKDDGKKEHETPPAPKLTAPPKPGEFAKPKPKFEDFAKDDDPAAAFYQATAEWTYEKREFDAKQKADEASAKSGAEEFQKWWADRDTDHGNRLAAHVKANPEDWKALQAAGDLPLTPIVYAAVKLHSDGPRMMVALAKHAELADELFLLTSGHPLGDPTRNPLIPIVQRKLAAGFKTGQALERSPKAPQWQPPPAPPTPVRTQSVATPANEDDKERPSGLLAHARKFSPRD